jgi:hypothetical protein
LAYRIDQSHIITEYWYLGEEGGKTQGVPTMFWRRNFLENGNVEGSKEDGWH